MHLRRLTQLLLLALVALLLSVALASCQSEISNNAPDAERDTEPRASNWPQFRGNSRLTGVAATDVRDDLELLWTYQAAESIESSAAIVDGVVYVGSQAGELLALRLETGELIWRFETADPIAESSPAVHDGTVYIGDLGGTLYAVDAADGSAVWSYTAEGEIRSSPAVLDGAVYFGSYDGHLYALSASDGAFLWKVQTEGQVHSTPAFLEGRAHFTGCDANFRTVRADTGELISSVPTGAYTGGSAALGDDAAYFGTHANEVLGVALEDPNAPKINWIYEHETRHFPFQSSAALIGNKVILGGRDKMVHAIDVDTGEELWTFMTRARVESSPAIAGNRVYVGSSDGRFYVLDADTGEKLWDFEAGAPLSASPAIASGTVVIGDQDGRLYAFR